MTKRQIDKYWERLGGYEREITSYLATNQHTCWCEFCKNSIGKEELYFMFYKRAYHFADSPAHKDKPSLQKSNMARINICLMCLDKLNKNIRAKPKGIGRKSINKMKNRLMLDKLEEN